MATTTETTAGPAAGPEASAPAEPSGAPRGRRLTAPWRGVVVALTLAGILVVVNQVFYLNLGGLVLLENSFLYLLIALFLPIVFLARPIRKNHRRARDGVPAYDVALAALLMAVALYFSFFGEEIQEFGWAFVSPPTATVLSVVLWALVLEVLRRTAGLIVTVLAGLVSLYPLIADEIPVGFLRGITYDFTTLAQVHAMGDESILGLPLQTAGTVVIGFLVFGVVLQRTGGAEFFHDLASAIFGRFRGGTAKVPIASSAAMGMMSGSPVSNVLTTGPLTIPTMTRSGLPAKTAAAIEATASSGGSITPPIMGTAAFLMVSFAGVSYTEIIIAATIPAALYFFGIFVQVDALAARQGLAGTPKEKLPRLARALIKGWPYLTALVVLTVLLVVTGREAQAPYWVILLLLAIGLAHPGIPFGPRQWVKTAQDVGTTLADILGIIAGVGLILGGLSATGVALSISRDLIAAVGENTILILITGAAACFVLGMGLTISAAYVFLAIVMVPALTALGIDTIAAHLFVIYWAGVSYITPPVGLAAIAAASIAGTKPMATSLEAMKLGAVKYLIPFGFALNPALVAQDSIGAIAASLAAALLGVLALGSALSGWFVLVETRLDAASRVALAAGGLLLLAPSGWAWAAGTAIILLLAAGHLVARRRRGPSSDAPQQEAEPAPAA